MNQTAYKNMYNRGFDDAHKGLHHDSRWSAESDEGKGYNDGYIAGKAERDREAAIFKDVFNPNETDLEYFNRRKKELGL